MWELFWKESSFGSRVVHVISIQKKGRAQKYFWKMNNIWSMCLEALIKVISEHHDFGTCVFGHWKGLASLKLVASLNAYQITNYQFPSKTHHFLLLDFRKIQEEVYKSRILWPIVWAGTIKKKVHLIFQKLCPSGHQGLLFKWFQNESECLSRWIYYQQ